MGWTSSFAPDRDKSDVGYLSAVYQDHEGTSFSYGRRCKLGGKDEDDFIKEAKGLLAVEVSREADAAAKAEAVAAKLNKE